MKTPKEFFFTQLGSDPWAEMLATAEQTALDRGWFYHWTQSRWNGQLWTWDCVLRDMQGTVLCNKLEMELMDGPWQRVQWRVVQAQMALDVLTDELKKTIWEGVGHDQG